MVIFHVQVFTGVYIWRIWQHVHSQFKKAAFNLNNQPCPLERQMEEVQQEQVEVELVMFGLEDIQTMSWTSTLTLYDDANQSTHTCQART